MKSLIVRIAAIALGLACTQAQAWDAVATGTVSKIWGVGGVSGAPGNYDIRVQLQGQTNMCPGAPDPAWYYVNANDGNYKALVAMLLTAQVSGKPVTLSTFKNSQGYCQIGLIALG